MKINKPLSVPEENIDELLEITNFEVTWTIQHLMGVNMLKGKVQSETHQVLVSVLCSLPLGYIA